MELEHIAGPVAPRSTASRSCTTCAKAKAKCVKTPDQAICERCTRLHKECHLKEPVARRRKSNKTSRAAQLEKLESKIEHLVNALAVSQPPRRPSTHGTQLSPPLSSVDSTSDVPSSIAPSQTTADELIAHLCHSRSTTPEQSEPSDDPCPLSQAAQQIPFRSPFGHGMDALAEAGIQASIGIRHGEAEELLNRYQRLMAANFPFVIIPRETTALDLYTTKPFLLRAIITVTSFHDLTRQRLMIKDCLRDMTERVFMNNEKNLGIVQGLLVLVAWYHPHIFWASQSSNLLGVATALVIDMGIDRPAGQCEGFKATTPTGVSGPFKTAKHSNSAETRALAGLFYLSSHFSSSFKRADAKPFTKFLDTGLRALEKAREYESDRGMVVLTRLQHMMEDANQLEVDAAPTSFHVKTFLAELNRYTDRVNIATNNVALQLQLIATELCILEMPFTQIMDRKGPVSRSNVDDIVRLSQTIQAFSNTFLTISCETLWTLPFSIFGQYGHSIVLLARVATMELDGLRPQDLKDVVDFCGNITRAIDIFNDMSRARPDGLVLHNEAFAGWGQRLKFMKQMFDVRFGATCNPSGVTSSKSANQNIGDAQPFDHTSLSMGAQQPFTPPDDMLSGDFLNNLDDSFWSTFAGDFNFNFGDIQMT